MSLTSHNIVVVKFKCSTLECLQGSLDRLNQKSLDLYQIHWPGFPIVNSVPFFVFCFQLLGQCCFLRTCDCFNKVWCLQGSLDRLNQKSVDLYQIHWPGFPIVNSWANDAFCKGLVECQKQGLAKAVGVSNYNVNRMQRAHNVMRVRLAFPYPSSMFLFWSFLGFPVMSVFLVSLLSAFVFC